MSSEHSFVAVNTDTMGSRGMKKAWGLIRVSTGKQRKSGLGHDAQESRIVEFCRYEGIELLGILVETESRTLDAAGRPVLAEVLANAKRDNCSVMVAKLDRLSGDVEFIAGLMKHGVPFIVCALGLDVPPFMLHVYAAVAQEECKVIGERTKAALDAKKVREPDWKPGRAKTADGKLRQRAGNAAGGEASRASHIAFIARVGTLVQAYRETMTLAEVAEIGRAH